MNRLLAPQGANFGRSSLRGTMTLIQYNGEIVAVASRLRVHLVDPRPREDPMLRFIHAMGAYARDVLTGELPGPYTDKRAEAYARAFLIPDDDFQAHAGDPDDELATRYGVPVEQIALKRRDADTTRPTRSGRG